MSSFPATTSFSPSQENAFPWIEKGIGIELDKWNVPKVDKITYQSTRPEVFFGGDAHSAQEHHLVRRTRTSGRDIDSQILPRRGCRGAHAARSELVERKMGMHEWAYKNEYNGVERRLVPHVGLIERFKKINIEVELGFTAEEAALRSSAA